MNTSPYFISSPVPDRNGTMVPGRLCGLSPYNDMAIMEDLAAHAHEKGNFLRTYTLTVAGSKIYPYPRNVDELRSKKTILLNKIMPVELRAIVGKALGISKIDLELPTIISSNPGLINELWDQDEFQNVNVIGWSGSYTFGRKLHHNLTFFALRDKSCINNVVCYQNESINLDNIHIIS